MALTVIVTVLGLVAGAAANVPIDRWPHGPITAVPPQIACGVCGAPRRVTDLLMLRAWQAGHRCVQCGARRSARPVVVMLVTAAVAGALTISWGADPRLPAFLVFAWAMIVAAAIDIEHRIIPNRLTLRLPLVLLVLVTLAALATGQWSALVRAAIASVVVPAVLLLISETYRLLRGRVGIGMGDIKLAVSIGLVVGYLGVVHLVVFIYAAMLSAVAVALMGLLAGRLAWTSRVPFGPYLAAGSLLPVAAGDAVIGWVRAILGT